MNQPDGSVARRPNFGFVYVLTNPCMPGIVKIGQSERHPGIRAAEMSGHEGVPAPFEVAFFQAVDDRGEMERAIHTVLAHCRVSPEREFFRIEPKEAFEVLRTVLPRDVSPVESAIRERGKCIECGGSSPTGVPKCRWCGAWLA